MNKNIKYTALFVKDIQDLLKRFPPKHKNVFGHHSTIEFKPENLEGIEKGKEYSIKIIGRAYDEFGDDLLVENIKSKNKYPHITLSRGENAPPLYSKILFEKAISSKTIEYFDNEKVEVIENYEMDDKEKISIDVVLLLPENINTICKELNKTSDKKEYVSFEDGYNPHITLGMGSLLLSDIEVFQKELGVLLKNFKIPEVSLTGLGSGKYNHFTLEVNENLQKLHNTVFDLITKYSAGIVVKENFFEMYEPGSLIDWVNNFKENSAYEKYHPHITLGIGITEIPLNFPIIFKPVSVGFFHLGKYGTCKKMLNTFNLK